MLLTSQRDMKAMAMSWF